MDAMTGQRRRLYVAQLEGMAAVGLVKSYWLEDCGIPGMKRVIIEDNSGAVYETKCIDYRAAKKVIMYLANAIQYSSDIVRGESDVEDKEEVFEEADQS